MGLLRARALGELGVPACSALLVASGCQVIGGFEDHELLVDAGVAATGPSGAGAAGGASSSSDASSSSSSSAGGSPSCPPGESSCNGSCVDTSVDPANCGMCGVSCGGTGACAGGQCECGGSGLSCAAGCIDPATDLQHCGASGDCVGPNAGAACGPSAECVAGACDDTCDNCGFEDNSFAGWSTQDVPNPYEPLAVVGPGAGVSDLPNQTAPSEGTKALLTGFDGSPGTIEVGQDVTLRPGSSPELQFDYRAAWDLTYGAMVPRTFEVWIEPAGGGNPLSQTTILTALPNTIDDSGDSIGTVPLLSYAGQTVFIRFVWTVPRDTTGPAFFQLDDVRIVEP